MGEWLHLGGEVRTRRRTGGAEGQAEEADADKNEAEREKRDFNDRLENERQSTSAALLRLETQKQEYDKLHQESAQIGETSQTVTLCGWGRGGVIMLILAI